MTLYLLAFAMEQIICKKKRKKKWNVANAKLKFQFQLFLQEKYSTAILKLHQVTKSLLICEISSFVNLITLQIK
jgi:hypothetical protein